MNKVIIKILFFICYTSYSYASIDAYILYIKSGKINSFSNEYEKFELEFDGSVKWEINQSGLMLIPGCGNEAGSFSGKLTDVEINTLVKLAEKVIHSQPKNEIKPSKSKGIEKTLQLILGDRVLTSNISKSTLELKKFNEYVENLKQNLSPQSIMRMNAKVLNNGKLKVRFKYFGKGPYLFLLPKKAKDAFRVPGYDIIYDKKLGFKSIEFSKSNRVKNIIFKLVPNGDKVKTEKLRYSNRNILHNAKNDFVNGQLIPKSINICTQVIN